ncbi:MAG: hypothetical protein EBZ48_10025 [Proteobacteria bacterium]|nr:hypothetical protein [Pseudomonadota bacterium]
MEQGQKQKGLSEQQLNKVCQYVNDMWFPVNATQLQKIQSSLTEGVYDKQLELLVTDLKSDPALFMFCVRELLRRLRQRGELCTAANQFELFVQGGLETLTEILRSGSEAISPHSLQWRSSLQENRLTEMFVSASTTETLCEESEVDPDLGFTVALFRQLGLALIAWNYPRVYRDAAIEAQIQGSFDRAIARRLGVAPGTLGVRLCKGWGMPAEMLAAVSEYCQGEGLPQSQALICGEALSETVATLCRVGESLARANNPEQYPTARSDWNDARNAIEDRLGTEGISRIRARVGQYSHALAEELPTAFQAGIALDPELRLSLRAKRNPGELPSIFKTCTLDLQSQLRRIYRALDAKQPTAQVLGQWKNDVTCCAGFSGGYVYSLEPILRMLIPQVAFGSADLKKTTEVRCDDRSHIVSEAFKSPSPIHRDFTDGNGEVVHAIAGVFGYSSRVGVVYVEATARSYEADPNRQMLHFWALVNSLTDCLALQ